MLVDSSYCCINCMHILPDLETLEKKYPPEKGLVVIGVHSAKFTNEKKSANILSAILRYGITHPVVNDKDADLWQKLMIQCWPTLLILGPEGQAVFTLVGEGNKNRLYEYIDLLLDYYNHKGQIQGNPLPIQPAKINIPESPLYFPGKISASESGRLLAVSDSGHHRIIIINKQGVIQFVIGDGSHGYNDGKFDVAKFRSPQGLCWYGDTTIYVADTENHSIRKIDLKSRQVTTIAGTGTMGDDKEGGKPGLEQPLSSPWDVCVGPAPGSASPTVLYIAMSGSHQIWGYFLEDVVFWRKCVCMRGTCKALAGSGAEENRNNNYPMRASFAQPSGISIAGGSLYIADSESSSIRKLLLTDGGVKHIVGGERDPKNLFAYGDNDGIGIEAKLQHPLAVCALTKSNSVLVADTYNHKIKTIKLETNCCQTLAGGGKAGDQTGGFTSSLFNEPSGLCIVEDDLYITDTNNHCIKIMNIKTEITSTLPMLHRTVDTVDYTPQTQERLTTKSAPVIELDPITIKIGDHVTLPLRIELPEGYHMTPGAPSGWQIILQDEPVNELLTDGMPLSGDLEEEGTNLDLSVPRSWSRSETARLVVECVVYHCHGDVCGRSQCVLTLPINIDCTSTDSNDDFYTIHNILNYQIKNS